MRIIGFKLYNDFKDFRAGFYPIGNFSKPNEFDFIQRDKNVPEEIEHIYDTESGVHVTVSAILCWKYKFIEQLTSMMFSMMQFFNVYILKTGEWNVDLDNELPEFKLYFEIDDEIWMFHKQNNKGNIFKIHEDSEPEEITIGKNKLHIVQMFNYGLENFIPPAKKSIDNIVYMFNESNMHLHPQEQLTLIGDITDIINKKFKRTKNIHILIFTQSPFVLLDVFTHNLLYLNGDNRCFIQPVCTQTFAQHIHEQMKFIGMESLGGPTCKKLFTLLSNQKDLDDSLLYYVGDEFMRMAIERNRRSNFSS